MRHELDEDLRTRLLSLSAAENGSTRDQGLDAMATQRILARIRMTADAGSSGRAWLSLAWFGAVAVLAAVAVGVAPAVMQLAPGTERLGTDVRPVDDLGAHGMTAQGVPATRRPSASASDDALAAEGRGVQTCENQPLPTTTRSPTRRGGSRDIELGDRALFVLHGRAQATVSKLEPCLTVLALERGRVTVHARDLGGGTLLVATRRGTVEVHGTVFAVDLEGPSRSPRHPDEVGLRVAVAEGLVGVTPAGFDTAPFDAAVPGAAVSVGALSAGGTSDPTAARPANGSPSGDGEQQRLAAGQSLRIDRRGQISRRSITDSEVDAILSVVARSTSARIRFARNPSRPGDASATARTPPRGEVLEGVPHVRHGPAPGPTDGTSTPSEVATGSDSMPAPSLSHPSAVPPGREPYAPTDPSSLAPTTMAPRLILDVNRER